MVWDFISHSIHLYQTPPKSIVFEMHHLQNNILRRTSLGTMDTSATYTH